MKDKKECKIIQDLLPNYIENLTNEETNQYIQEHINACKECKEILENMKNNINLADKEREDKEVKYMKKFNNKMNILKAIIFMILLIVLIIIISRVTILLTLSNKVNQLDNISNFYAKMYHYNGENSVDIIECYYKDEAFITTTNSLTESGSRKMTMYQNKSDNESIILIDLPSSKVAQIYDGIGNAGFYTISKESRIIDLKCTSIIDLIKKLISIKNISTTKCAGQKCYLIELWNEQQLWVSKDTGLPIRECGINPELTDVTDFQYILNSIESKNLEKPELDGYIIEEVNSN